jgi:hypothetical protein
LRRSPCKPIRDRLRETDSRGKVISDDMLACLDALRWAKADLHTLVPGGEERVQAVRAMWGLIPTQG